MSDMRFAAYRDYLQSHDMTVRTPIQSLMAWAAWVESRGLTEQAALSLAAILEYAADMKRRGLSPRTRSTYLFALSGYYGYAVKTGAITPTAQEAETVRDEIHGLLRDIGRAIKRDPLHKRLPPASVIGKALDAVRDVAEGTDANAYIDALRNRALILSLASTGARVSELAGLRRGDLDAEGMAATVTGKGGKKRTVYFSTEAWAALQAYFTDRLDEAYPKNPANNAVFAAQTGKNGKPKPLTVRDIQRIVQGVAAAAGIEDFHLTPHAFRHFVATKFLQSTGDLAMTQDLLGHASPVTTRVYAATNEAAMKSKHKEIFDALSDSR